MIDSEKTSRRGAEAQSFLRGILNLLLFFSFFLFFLNLSSLP